MYFHTVFTLADWVTLIAVGLVLSYFVYRYSKYKAGQFLDALGKKWKAWWRACGN